MTSASERLRNAGGAAMDALDALRIADDAPYVANDGNLAAPVDFAGHRPALLAARETFAARFQDAQVAQRDYDREQSVKSHCSCGLVALLLLSALWITGVVQHCRGTADPIQAQVLMGIGLGLSAITVGTVYLTTRNRNP
jgi:hypothetical protein